MAIKTIDALASDLIEEYDVGAKPDHYVDFQSAEGKTKGRLALAIMYGHNIVTVLDTLDELKRLYANEELVQQLSPIFLETLREALKRIYAKKRADFATSFH